MQFRWAALGIAAILTVWLGRYDMSASDTRGYAFVMDRWAGSVWLCASGTCTEMQATSGTFDDLIPD